jgi:hypothetical protein
VNDQMDEDARRTWWSSLTPLLADAALPVRWQERRYGFAHRVGTLLSGADEDGAPSA